MQTEQQGYRFVFKILVTGPDDYLNDRVLRLISHSNLKVDGIAVHVGGVPSKSVRITYWNPQKDALKILISLSYQGAKGALIVSSKEDKKSAVRYRTEVKKKCGNIPTSLFIIGKNKTSAEISNMANLMVRELVARIKKKTFYKV